jgi:hypothetical protein
MASLYGPALWTIAGFVLYVLGGLGSLLVFALLESTVLDGLGLRPTSGELSLSLRNGMHALAWGLVAAAAAAPLGRRLIPDIRFHRQSTAMLALGLSLAAVITLLVNEYGRSRYGYFDPDAVGIAFFAGPALIAVALGTWAALAVGRDGVLMPGAAALTAVCGLALAMLPSVPGATDGIASESVPLAAGFVAAAAYGGLATAMIVRRAVAGSTD